MYHPMGIKRAEHIPFFHWCRNNGLLVEPIVSKDRVEFYVRWFKRWYLVPEYGMVDIGINYLIHVYRTGKTLKEYKA